MILQELHGEVWRWRDRMRATWPEPDRLNSLRFAATEAAEAIDATLRADPKYLRNNHKGHDLRGELAQCALMLYTALGPDAATDEIVLAEAPTLEGINYEIAAALHIERVWSDSHDPVVRWIVDNHCWRALQAIADYPKFDLANWLAIALGELEAKWGPKPEFIITGDAHEDYPPKRLAP